MNIRHKFRMRNLIAATVTAALVTVTFTPTATAAKCTKAELNLMQKVDFQMALASISGDLKGVFKAVSTARNGTKNPALKKFYNQVESAVESDNGVLSNGPSRKMWRTLQSKLQYKRC